MLIISSGNIVHNLQLFNFNSAHPYEWAERFNDKVKEYVISGNHKALIHYKPIGQDAALSVPIPEHYLPLLYALALKEPEDKISLFNDMVISSISMTSVIIGQ
ncbi:hypothetical protein EB001_27545 [bacterium]|nr:hypothetical protein [bacterium]